MHAAAAAFDSIAGDFDRRFRAWLSVAAQRRAVRRILLDQFPPCGRILELGGGTGDDAAYLAQRGFQLLSTDPSPAMVALASERLAPLRSHAIVAEAENLLDSADLRNNLPNGELFDGAFSNFAPLNCVFDLGPVAKGLARLLKPGAPALLVVFGTSCPGEIATQLLQGHPRRAFRRFQRGKVEARLAGSAFHVAYHRRYVMERAFAPWFKLEKRFGIGIAVPPSAAEPWISRQPRLLALMEVIDRVLRRPLAPFGDHVLYQFRRNSEL